MLILTRFDSLILKLASWRIMINLLLLLLWKFERVQTLRRGAKAERKVANSPAKSASSHRVPLQDSEVSKRIGAERRRFVWALRDEAPTPEKTRQRSAKFGSECWSLVRRSSSRFGPSLLCQWSWIGLNTKKESQSYKCENL